MFDEIIEVSGGDFVAHIVSHRPNRHGIDETCPRCGENVMKIAITKLVYTHEICDCGMPEYRHLIERLWHKKCFVMAESEK